jgi:hypothetical protein
MPALFQRRGDVAHIPFLVVQGAAGASSTTGCHSIRAFVVVIG